MSGTGRASRPAAVGLALVLALGPFRAAWGAGASPRSPLVLTQKRDASGVRVWAENTDPDAVRWVWLSFAFARNAYAQPAFPAGFVLQPRQKLELATILPESAAAGYAYGLSESTGEGDPTRDPDPGVVYLLPYAHGTKHLVSQGYFGKASHQGLYALDFVMPDGTTITAARGGVVIGVKQDSDVGGPSAEYASAGNYVEIMHPDATWALYAHIEQGGALVSVGESVRAGEPIALSGHTGEATGPHLHFAVYRASWEGPRSIPTVFLTGVSRSASLVEGATYYSYHPGGPPFVPVLGADIGDADLRGVTLPASGTSVTLLRRLVDRRAFVWADNPTPRAVDLSVGVEDPQGALPSVPLPFPVEVPPHTEVYCFHVDLVGEGRSSFRLTASWTWARP